MIPMSSSGVYVDFSLAAKRTQQPVTSVSLFAWVSDLCELKSLSIYFFVDSVLVFVFVMEKEWSLATFIKIAKFINHIYEVLL